MSHLIINPGPLLSVRLHKRWSPLPGRQFPETKVFHLKEQLYEMNSHKFPIMPLFSPPLSAAAVLPSSTSGDGGSHLKLDVMVWRRKKNRKKNNRDSWVVCAVKYGWDCGQGRMQGLPTDYIDILMSLGTGLGMEEDVYTRQTAQIWLFVNI